MSNNSKSGGFTKWLFEKGTILFGIALISFFVFNPTITSFLDKTLVHYLASNVTKPTIFLDFIALAIIVMICLFYFIKKSDYIPSNRVAALLSLLLIFYLFYRLYYPYWNFISFYSFNSIKYLDIIILIAILNALFWTINWVKSDPLAIDRKKNLLFDDNPIKEEEDDDLGYHKYAKSVVEKIEKSRFDAAFAIGVNAPWGMGKTSFINLIIKNLNKENNIVVKFNPWDCQNPEAIIKDFFNSLQEEIRPYHSSLARRLTDYSNRLIKINDGIISNTIHIAVASIAGVESLDKIHEEINNALKKINKRLIITIDDIDRLNSKEIIEVLRLIRNTANFYNTFFLVAYDRNYVINSLKTQKTHQAETFLEKIFQIEITLPQFDKYVLLNKFNKIISPHINNQYFEEVQNSIWGTIFKPSRLRHSLNNMRDVTRLANSVVLNYSELQGEVLFDDFIKLEIIRLKYPTVYEMLYRKTEQILASENNTTKNYFVLKREDKSETFKIEELLKNKCHETGITPCEINDVINLVASIFTSEKATYSTKKISHLSVTNPSSFKRYFNYALLKDDLSEIDFSNTRQQKEYEFFKHKIDEWIKCGKIELLRQRFMDINAFDDINDFEKIIKAIFHFATRNVEVDGKSIQIGFDSENLKEKFSQKGNMLYENSGIPEDLKVFAINLFKSATPPYIFEAQFIRHLTNEFGSSLLIEKDDLNKYALSYFKEYCQSFDKINSDFWTLYHCCTQTGRNEISPGNYERFDIKSVEANQIMKDFITYKDLDGFLFEIIHVEGHKQKTFSTSDFAKTLFGEWSNFKEFLIAQDESKWKYLTEFKDFFDVFESSGFKKNIPFEFKAIPINLKFRN